ncbi:SRPBCC family protein [Deinococcus hopiensis]|uniref:Carbon monoxide dehydrogenase subunit G n=1 Tax=Deinococcus hopiensis KR-140 TaxID=695939 RepID=A0A1W1V8C7_9DEIO|nr:carbon monoxide dehydrogenase subunit G [Deinococcus hopiensis]SMB89496.1 hypothetical protein SAMN00790413_00451 [Deinococcus hopiensis KR-140]
MNFNQTGQEQIQAPPGVVWAFVCDAARVARCLPHVQDVDARGEGAAEASVQVGVGMLRGKFKLRVEVFPDASAQHVRVRVRGGGLGSNVELNAGATVVDNGGGTTRLDWNGEASLSGPVAKVGGRSLDGRLQGLIRQTFRNMGNQLRTQGVMLV